MSKRELNHGGASKNFSNYLQRFPRVWRVSAKIYGINGFNSTKLNYKNNELNQDLNFLKVKKYRFVFDGQCLQTMTRQRGIGKYSINLIKAICKNEPNDSFCVFLTNVVDQTNTTIAKTILEDLNLANLDVFVLDVFENSKKIKLDSAQYNLRKKLENIGCAIVICLSNFENPKQVISISKSPKYKRIGILYDLIPKIFPDQLLVSRENKERYVWSLVNLQEFDLLLSISYGSKNSWINCGLSNIPIEVISGSSTFDLKDVNLQSNYQDRFGILCVGAEQKHKNLEVLIKAYLMLEKGIREKHNLTVVGIRSEGERKRLRKLAKQANATILFPGYLDDRELKNLYINSRILVMPSIMEGLSLPILEAWSFGLLAIGSKGTLAEELIEDNELLFDSKSAKDLKNHMKKYISDENAWQKGILRSKLKSKEFTWKKSATKAINAINSIDCINDK